MGITVLGTARALYFLRSKNQDTSKQVISDTGLQPISILKPLKGIDPGIRENLASFFFLEYPQYEILFSVAEADDPVIPIVQSLMQEHSDVPAQLIIGALNDGPNPKINNLLKSYELALHDWILISDSNTRFSQGHLQKLALQFKEGADMQTSLIAGIEGKGLGGLLECAFLNTFYARSIVSLDALGHTVVMGKAMMFRKSVMYHTRGLRSLKRHIAEDYAAGRKFSLLGHRLQLSQDPVQQFVGHHSLKEFWSRHIRWGRLRKMQSPLGFATEPLLCSILSGVLGAIAANLLWGWSMLFFFFLHMATWFAADVAMARKVTGKPLGWGFLSLWILRELTQLPLLVHISLGSRVIWRGQLIQLKREKFLERRIDILKDEEKIFDKTAI